MNFQTVQEYADHLNITPIEKETHRTGAEIFIGEKYSNYDPECPVPHWQTWWHVAFGEDKPLAGQILYTRFAMQVSRAARVRSAKRAADEFIGAVIDGYRREHV